MKGITEHKIQRVITFRELLSRRLEADAAITCTAAKEETKKSV